MSSDQKKSTKMPSSKISREALVKARAALENNSKRLQRSEVELFAAGIAHEFNNVLGAALGHAEWALDTKSSDDMVEALETVIKACERAREITWALKGLAQPREERLEAHSAIKIFDEVTEWAKVFFGHQNIPFTSQHELIKDEHIFVDFDQIKEILLNLIKNARDAVVSISQPEVYLTLKVVDQHLEFCVSDSGSGVSPEFRDMIFQPFFTTKGSMSHVGSGSDLPHATPMGGMGLGLYLAKNTALEHGGSLTLGKKPSEFILKLPLL